MMIDIWEHEELIACRFWDVVPRKGEEITLYMDGLNIGYEIHKVRWYGEDRPKVMLEVKKST